MTVPALRSHADAVAAVLQAAFDAVTPPVPLGVGRRPDDTASDRWAVLYPLGPEFDGPVGDRAADLTYGFQVTSVASSVEQVEWLADLVRAALFGGVPVAGRHADPVTPTGGAPVQRDDDQTPPVYFRPETFTLFTSPA